MSADLSKCQEQIVKIGKNNVEVQYYLLDSEGEKVVVHTETYGKIRIEEEREEIEKEKVRINSTDKITNLAKEQTKLDKLDIIEVSLTKKEVK